MKGNGMSEYLQPTTVLPSGSLCHATLVLFTRPCHFVCWKGKNLRILTYYFKPISCEVTLESHYLIQNSENIIMREFNGISIETMAKVLIKLPRITSVEYLDDTGERCWRGKEQCY